MGGCGECSVLAMQPLMLSSIDRAEEVFTLEPIIRFIIGAARRGWTWRKRGPRVGGRSVECLSV